MLQKKDYQQQQLKPTIPTKTNATKEDYQQHQQ